MRVGNSYDLVVAGGELGGYLLATAVAHNGKKVLVVDPDLSQSFFLESQKPAPVTDFSYDPIIGLYSGSTVDRFLRKVGLYKNMDDLFLNCTPALQLISGSGRVNFSYPMGEMEKEWTREFPKYAQPLKILSSSLSKDRSIRTHKKFDFMVKKSGLSSHWAHLGRIQAPLYGMLNPKSIPLGLVRTYLQYASHGVHYCMNNRQAMKKTLIERLHHAGGKVKSAAGVGEIIFERKKLMGVLLSSFEGFVKTKQVVGAMNSRNFMNLLPPEYRYPSLVNEVNGLKPSYWRFNFMVKVDHSAIPEGMSSHVCYYDPDSSANEEDFLQLFVFPPSKQDSSKKRVILVRTLVPFTEKGITPHYLGVTIKRCLQRMESFIPFLKDGLFEISPDPNHIEEDPVYKKHFRFHSLDDVSRELLVYDSTADSNFLSGVRSDWSSHGLPGVSLCARDVVPSLGFMGEILTSISLFKKVMKSK